MSRRISLAAGIAVLLVPTVLAATWAPAPQPQAAPAASSSQRLAAAAAAEPTFSRDVLPIIQDNCQVCHRPQGQNLGGMVAPMPLITYEDVEAYAVEIEMAVGTGYMPPWHAAREHLGAFENERTLSDGEIETILTWIADGAPRGDLADAPPPVSFPSDTSGWSIGEPDLVVRFSEPYVVADDVEDEYVDIEVPITLEMMPEDRWIKAVEFRPGSSAVHHIIAGPLGGIAPGYEPRVYEEGRGRLLTAGTVVNFQMHYHKEAGPGTAVTDLTEAAVIFYQPGEEITHIVESESLGMFDFAIPPGDPSYAYQTEAFMEKDVNVIAINPHMHLRGKAARYVATFPDGREQVLLDVPEYDFNWQHTYRYREPIFLPEGTRVELTLWWDNSPDNPSNPNPDREVRWGQPTTDEMGFGFMRYVDVVPRSIIVGEPAPDDLPRGRGLARPPDERREGPPGKIRTGGGITGKWVVSVHLGDQGGEATFELEQGRRGVVMGTYSGALGEAEISGRARGPNVEFSFESPIGTVTYTGRMTGIVIEGTCVYGELGEGTFAGEKVD